MSKVFKKPEINYFLEVEKYRIYYFSDGSSFKVENVKGYAETDSGKHILETVNGKKYIINKTWISVEIDVENWT